MINTCKCLNKLFSQPNPKFITIFTVIYPHFPTMLASLHLISGHIHLSY